MLIKNQSYNLNPIKQIKKLVIMLSIAGIPMAGCSKDENNEPEPQKKAATIMWGDSYDRLHPDTIRELLNRKDVSEVILENDGKSQGGISTTTLCNAAFNNAFAIDPKRVKAGKTPLVGVQVTTEQHKADSVKMADVYLFTFGKMYQKQK